MTDKQWTSTSNQPSKTAFDSKRPYKCPNSHAIKWKSNSNKSPHSTKNKHKKTKPSKTITANSKENTSNPTPNPSRTTTLWSPKSNNSKKSSTKNNATWNKSKSNSFPVLTKICSESNLSLKCKDLISKLSTSKIKKSINLNSKSLSFKEISKSLH